MSFDLARYREHKKEGLIRIEKKDGQTTFITKQFDRFTGKPIEDGKVVVDDKTKEQIVLIKSNAENVLENIKELQKDLK